jgi:hypothetical protein
MGCYNARRCTDPHRGVRSWPHVGAGLRSPPPSSSLTGFRSRSRGRVSGRIWPLWNSSSTEIMGPPNSNSASPAPGVAEAEHEEERSRWWMGIAGAVKKYPPPLPPKTSGARPRLDGTLANGVEQVLSKSSPMATSAWGRRLRGLFKQKHDSEVGAAGGFIHKIMFATIGLWIEGLDCRCAYVHNPSHVHRIRSPNRLHGSFLSVLMCW